MWILPLSRGALLCFSLSLALAASLSYADDKMVEVVGVGECADCTQNNFDTKQAFTGLHVTIDCKATDGHFKTRGSAELDKEGKFKVSLPKDIVKEGGELKEECYAQLHSASSAPCPAHESLESSKIVVSQSKTAQKHTFGLTGNLKFSPITCASKFFWHHFHKRPSNQPSPPKAPEVPVVPPPTPEVPVVPPPAPKKEKPCPPKEKPPKPPKKEEPCPPKEKPPKPPKKEKPCPPKEKPPKPPKKEKPCPPKKEEPEIPPPTTPEVKPLPPPTPTYKHPFYKHPFFKDLPPFPKLPPHPFLPPHP